MQRISSDAKNSHIYSHIYEDLRIDYTIFVNFSNYISRILPLYFLALNTTECN